MRWSACVTFVSAWILLAAGCVELHELVGNTRFPPPDDTVDMPIDGGEEPSADDEMPDDETPSDNPDDADTNGTDDTPVDETPAGPNPPADDDPGDEPPPDEPVDEEPEGIPPLPEGAEVTTLDSGLQVFDFVVGTGDAPPDETANVNVAYTGYLPDGTIFDSSESANFNLNGVIAGFREGILGMRVGGSRRLIIPPDLGYGPGGNAGAGIGGEDTITFDVDLLAINE